MRPLPLLLVLALTGCARVATPAGDEVARTLAGRISGPPQRCITFNQSDGLRPLDDRTLAYGGGRTIWINRLEGACPGIRPLSTVIVEVIGSQYCRGDRIRGLEPGGIIPGPTCVLQDWVPYRRP